MRRYLTNTLWMLADKLVTTFSSLIITIYTARYLGPEKLGLITFAISLVAIIIPIGQLGSQTLIFDKIAKRREVGVKLLQYSNAIRVLLYSFCSFLLALILYHSTNNEEFLILILAIISGFFTTIDGYKPYFDATLKSKINSISNQIALAFALTSRLVLVQLSVSAPFFMIPYLFQSVLPYFIRKKKFFELETKFEDNRNVKEKKNYRNFAIKAGVPLAISSLSVIIYLKVAQIILANKLGVYEVGLYSAASLISQGWNFLPMTIMTVLLTRVLKDRKNKLKGFSFILFVCSTICIFVCAIINFNKDWIIENTYGVEFIDAGKLIIFLSLATLFSIIGTVSYRFILNYGGYKFLMKKMIFCAGLNIVLSWILIDTYGLIGAGISVLLTEFISATVLNYLFMKGLLFKVHIGMPFSLTYFKRILN